MFEVSVMTEFELKFEVSPVNLKVVVAAMQQGMVTRQCLQASYFDTDDRALQKCGIVVRLRKEGRQWVQTAKAPTADVLERLEHNVAVSKPSVGILLAPDLSRHRGTAVGKAIDEALAIKAHHSYPELHLVYGTDIQRTTAEVIFNGSVIEIALDQGWVFAGNGLQANSAELSHPVCELEFELKHGLAVDAVELARQWCASHGLWISTITKSMKAQRLGGHELCENTSGGMSTQPMYSRHATGHDMVTAVVAACLKQILPNMSELASGSKDADHIHQLRVGIRRLRVALSELRGFAQTDNPENNTEPDWAAWEKALVTAFRALGAHRDHSNLALVMQPKMLAAGGPAMRTSALQSKLVDLGDVVRKPAFQDALLGLLGLVYAAGDQPNKPNGLQKMVSRHLAKLHRQALHHGPGFLELNEEQQHEVRKKLKRLRYLIEFSAPLFAARKVDKKLRGITTALKPAQDALGLYNDEVMALHAWRALAVDDPNAWFGVGWLTARRQANARRCQKAINALAKIKPFWCK